MIDLGDTASKIKFGKNILGYSPQNEEGSNRGLRKIVAMNSGCHWGWPNRVWRYFTGMLRGLHRWSISVPLELSTFNF